MTTSVYPRALGSLGAAVFGVAALVALNVQAQAPEQILRGILNATRQGQTAPAPMPFPMPTPQQAIQPGLAPPAQPIWPSKAAFLDDARSGKLLGYNGINLNDERRVGGSLYAILVSDYGIPLMPRDCGVHFAGQATALIAAINRAYEDALTNSPPDFVGRNYNPSRSTQQLEGFKQPFRGASACAVGGQRQPYQDAMLSLAEEYQQTTAMYVDAERTRRQMAYQEAQARAQAAEEQRQAAARAAEQQKIDAEAARIRADEQRRAQKERARVGG
jgi:hypothetical protein